VTAQIIACDRIAKRLHEQVSTERQRAMEAGVAVGLATIRVGDDLAAAVYQRRVNRLATELDVECESIVLPADASQDHVRELIGRLNATPGISGILVLRPLPRHIDEAAIFRELAVVKDIEAVHPENAGLLALGAARYVPSTAAAIFEVLDSWIADAGYGADDFYHRSRIVVVGRSNNVGKPAMSLAYARQAAVASVDEWTSRSGHLGWYTRHADVLIVAAGVPGLIRAEHVQDGAVVLDVGINPTRDDAGRMTIVGDVASGEVSTRARAMTTVPGGIGPVTDVCLIRNVLRAAAFTHDARASVSRMPA
jgi:methylenetetrahydrofolate dehydrogenase (NADP+) / methenyltetrahydrofolate cyclohydrolase